MSRIFGTSENAPRLIALALILVIGALLFRYFYWPERTAPVVQEEKTLSYTVTATVNVRSLPSRYNSRILGTLEKGRDDQHRTGLGWSAAGLAQNHRWPLCRRLCVAGIHQAGIGGRRSGSRDQRRPAQGCHRLARSGRRWRPQRRLADFPSCLPRRRVRRMRIGRASRLLDATRAPAKMRTRENRTCRTRLEKPKALE